MLIRNPILWQELLHQTRSAPRAQRWELIVALLVAAGVIGGAVTLLRTGRDFGYLSTQFMLIALWAFSGVVMVRAVIAGANAISREHVGQTWDALVLTGVSARQIMVGKWLASLRRVVGWAVALSVVRLCALPLMMYSMTQSYAWISLRRRSPNYGDEYSVWINWIPWSSVAGVLVAIIMPFIEVAACTALGVAASAITRRAASAAVMAGLVRFIPIALTLHAGFVRYDVGTPMHRWWRFPSFSIADGGTVLMMRMVQPETGWNRGQHLWALTNLSGPLTLLLGFLLLSLVITVIVVKRRGALPHQQPLALVQETSSERRFLAG